jgi:hypothetical protein
MVMHTCNLTYSKGEGKKIVSLRPAKEKRDPISKTNKNKGTGDIAQVVEHLPSLWKVLDYAPVTT